MRTIGIIAEYNPFHSGHLYQIDQIRQAFGADAAVVCVMSGNWVQRGDAALFDKWTRAGMALRAGADLILELPTAWSISSAERFAEGGVAILTASGVVDTLSFGSETGTLAPLLALSDFLLSPDYAPTLRSHLETGCSFPHARQEAARAHLGCTADALSTANNNLGVEYLCAIRRSGSPLQAHTIARQGVEHDSELPSKDFASASQLRRLILSGSESTLAPYLLEADRALLQKADVHALHFATRAVLSRLRLLPPEALLLYPDCSEGLHLRLHRAALHSHSLDALYASTKSRRYTHARIRRLVLSAFLDLRQEDRPDAPLYLRVLGMTLRGQALLRRMKQTATLPLLTKAAHVHKLSSQAQQLFAQEARATALYDLCRRDLDTPALEEYRMNPVLL